MAGSLDDREAATGESRRDGLGARKPGRVEGTGDDEDRNVNSPQLAPNRRRDPLSSATEACG